MRKHHGDERRIADLNGSACRGKTRYSSKAHAKAAGRLKRRDDAFVERDHFLLVAYKCRVCSCWHVGNSHRRHDVNRDAIIQREATPLERALAEALRPYLGHAT